MSEAFGRTGPSATARGLQSAERTRVTWLAGAVALLTLAIGLMVPTRACAEHPPAPPEATLGEIAAFPAISEYKTLDGQVVDRNALFQFYSDRRTTDTIKLGLHPFFARQANASTGRNEMDFIWPFFWWRENTYQRYRVVDHRYFYFFPLFYSGGGTKDDSTRYNATAFVPLWISGGGANEGSYAVLFPLFWYGKDAKVRFLSRSKQDNFISLFPLFGSFRNETAHLQFLAWPLFVRNTIGKGDAARTNTSIGWPFFAIRSGKDMWGFRLWPLLSYANKKDEYNRAYFLWPFGHYRTGRVSTRDASPQRVAMLFPFFVDFRREKFEFFSILPLYASVKQKGRDTRGYLLATYNVDENRRTGIRDSRLLWFLIRWRERIPVTVGTDPVAQARKGTTGFAVFPFYWHFSGEERANTIIAWPIYTTIFRKYPKYDYRRTTVPFILSRRSRAYPDGRKQGTMFIFPFMQQTWREDGNERAKWLHFWMLKDIDAFDRNWSPLWRFAETIRNGETGSERFRLFNGLYDSETLAKTGESRWRFNLLFLSFGRRNGGEKAGGQFDLFWGLYGRKTEGAERRTRIFWIPI